jgi:muramoyltetrapeptide carboxypeptidase
MKTSIAPVHLSPGDAIAVVAPASPFERPALKGGLRLLESLGYRVVHRPDLFVRRAYLAGTDERRVDELHWALENPEIKAIWAVRGGYGVMRLLPLLDFERVASNPKIWLGFSDISALLAALWTQTGLIGIHGPQVVSLPRASSAVRAHLLKLITRTDADWNLLDCPQGCWQAGVAEGPLLPMNLAMLTSLLGTPYLPDFNGIILAIEDVNEAPYRIDRMLTQLSLAGVLDRIAGMVAGQFDQTGDRAAEQSAQIKKRLITLARQHSYPLLGDASFGHIDDNLALPVGARVRLDAKNGLLTLLEPAVSEPQSTTTV